MRQYKDGVEQPSEHRHAMTRCPTCDLAGDGLLNYCTPAAQPGSYPNGSPKWSPICSVHGDIGAIGTANSRASAAYLASRADHSWNRPHYCPDTWHHGKTGDALGQTH